MMNVKFLSLIGALLALGSSTILGSLPVASVSAQSPTKENLIGLFLVTRNNLDQQYRGEVYPIARYANGRYTDVSVDVTPEVREDTSEAEIIKRTAAKSILKSNPTLSFLNLKGQPSGTISVNRIGIKPFACSALLVGRGKVSETANLQTVFNQLPRDREGGYQGKFNGKPIDESYRWTVAIQSTTPPAPISLTSTQSQQYRRDLARIGAAEIAKDPQAKVVTGNTVVEELQVFDLDRDGKPEIYGRIRRGVDPKTIKRPNRDDQKPVAAYAHIWLSYSTPQPKLLNRKVSPYFIPVSDIYTTYNVVTTIDGNGDGKQEVLLQNIGYEGVNFSILELQGNQLKSVFTGAGYGC
jgi:hypothetical protein